MAELDTEERRKLADQGKALPDGSFPIRDREDPPGRDPVLRDVPKDKTKAKRWIKRRAW